MYKHRLLYAAVILFGWTLMGAGCSLQPVPTVPNTPGGQPPPTITGEQPTVSDLLPTLDLSNQRISKFPMYLLDRPELTELDLSHNQLEGAIPAEIRHLSNLKKLNLSYNKMTGLPAELGQLQDLEVLDVSYNRLTGLPYELGNLKNLKRLVLSGNDYSEQDLQVILQGIPQAEIVR